jgi:hypothetical protein
MNAQYECSSPCHQTSRSGFDPPMGGLILLRQEINRFEAGARISLTPFFIINILESDL